MISGSEFEMIVNSNLLSCNVCRLEKEQRRQKAFEQRLEMQKRQEQEREEEHRKAQQQREVCHC